MPRLHIRILAPVFLLPTLSFAQTFWAGQSGDYVIHWTLADLQAKSSTNRTVIFDAAQLAEARWKSIQKVAAADKSEPPRVKDRPDEAGFSYALLSSIGAAMSIINYEYCDCGGARPSSYTEFQAIDLTKSKPTEIVSASLDQYFPPDSIYRALMADKVVQTALAQHHPKDLPALLKDLDLAQYTQGDCIFDFRKELLTNFAFYDYHEGKTSIRISLSHGVETCRGDYIQLGIHLPVPPGALRTALESAEQGKRGVLMKQLSASKNQAERQGKPDRQTGFSFPE